VVDVHHCDCGGRGCGSPFAELRSTVGADER
jgi:hypothetical protein